MRIVVVAALALLAVSTAAAGAQLYRWVDDKGRVEWRDTPPPANAKNVETRNVGTNTIQTSEMPYSLQQAVKAHPVTLWTFDCGEPCTSARAYLARRGIPYTERSATRESDALKKLTGSLEVPVLVVGSRTLKGYLASDWEEALDNAGYPRSAPPGYKPQVQTASQSTPPQKPTPKAESPKPTARQP